MPPSRPHQLAQALIEARGSNRFLTRQDLETKESDLWGSRGVALAGLMMLFMALQNFRGTLVRGCCVTELRREVGGARLALLNVRGTLVRCCCAGMRSGGSRAAPGLLLLSCTRWPGCGRTFAGLHCCIRCQADSSARSALQASIVGKARAKEKAIARISVLRQK